MLTIKTITLIIISLRSTIVWRDKIRMGYVHLSFKGVGEKVGRLKHHEPHKFVITSYLKIYELRNNKIQCRRDIEYYIYLSARQNHNETRSPYGIR